MPGGTVYISSRDYETQRRMAASNPGISFGSRDYRNANVVVTDNGRQPSSSSNSGSSASRSSTSSSTASRSAPVAPTVSPSRPVSSSTSGGSSGSSGMVPIRSAIESRYGQGSVSYDPQTGTITLRDPRTGRIGTIAPNAYTEQSGTAYINPDYIRSWLNGGSSGGGSAGSVVSSNTSGSSGGNTAGNVPLRQYYENRGYTVTYNPEGTIWLGTSKQPLYAIGKEDYINQQGTAYLPESTAAAISRRLTELAGQKQAETDRISNMVNVGEALHQAGFTTGGDPFGYLAPSTMTYDQAIQLNNSLSQLSSQMGRGTLNETLSQMVNPDVYQAIQSLQQRPPQQLPEIQNILGQVQQLYTPDPSLAPLYSKALDQMMATIDTYQQQLTDQIKQQMGGVDPATQAALASLKDTVKRQRDSLMEEMSRRGLLQSGIWVEAEDRLNRGELTAQQQLLSTRLTALQDQLNQALQNFGNMRLNAMQTYGLKGIEQLNTEAQRRQEALQKNLEQALDQAYKQRQLDITQFQAQAPYMYGTWAQRNQLPQDWANITGTVPAGPGYEPVPVRDYVGSRGSVSYDPNTGNVLINGQPINPKTVGGWITPEGRSYIPRNIVDQALRRY